MKPLIGLSTYREQARWGVWDTSADLLPSDYARSIEAAGGIPVLLPPTREYAENARALVARLDGVVISGGADVGDREDRDAWEYALLDAAYERVLPTLGICRGMQVMAVHAGGELVQHVPDVVEHEHHSPGGDVYGEVEVRVESGSRLAGIIDAAPPVRCHHHQAVRTHPGFTAVAWAADGVLEAMEAPGEAFKLAVQWHPEVSADRGVFGALIDAAGA